MVDAPTKRGLAEIYRLAWADVENAEPEDFPGKQREELALGFKYLAALIHSKK